MKKAFVSVLLAVSLLSACSNQNIEIDHPTTPPTESVQKTIKPSEANRNFNSAGTQIADVISCSVS